MIGNWCDKQRKDKKENKLSQEKIYKLESLGIWHWGDARERKWYEMFDLLKKYVGEKNRFPIQTEKYENKPIGAWCNTQRCVNNSNKMPEERIAKLSAIPGWKF